MALVTHIKTHWIRYLVLLTAALFAIVISLFIKTQNNIKHIHPRYDAIIESIYGLGTVKSSQSYTLVLGVPATVKKLYVTEGQKVAKGDPLVSFDQMETFRAPMNGVVTSIPYHEEETVFPQKPVLQIENLKNRYIEVSLEQRGALRIKPGQLVHLVFESVRHEIFYGKVASIYPQNGEFLARIDNSHLPPEVLPGMTADVAIQVDRKSNALLIPLSSVNNGFVLRERDGEKKKVPIKIGSIDGKWAEVLEGDVVPSDFVIVEKTKRE